MQAINLLNYLFFLSLAFECRQFVSDIPSNLHGPPSNGCQGFNIEHILSNFIVQQGGYKGRAPETIESKEYIIFGIRASVR